MPATRTLAAVLLTLLIGCTDRHAHPEGSRQCGADEPTQLASKLDDDDGDGVFLDDALPDVDDEDDDIADHAWILDRTGVYHLFFHGENLYHPNQIEHYTTIDFQALHYVGVALTVNPGGWDADALWAPHVVEAHDAYYMFYTGVSGSGPDAVQRIGLATSSDLVNWTRLAVNRCPGTNGDGCVYDCDEPWTAWGEQGGAYDHQCRDAFVMWDAGARRWLMLATARSTNRFGVVTVASAGELAAWTGAGYVDATRRLVNGTGAQATGGQAENPFVVATGGRYFLLFTDWEDPEDSVNVAAPRTIAQYAASGSLSFDADGSPAWTYRGYLPDPGVNAIEVLDLRRPPGRLMSQSIAYPTSGVPRRHRRELRIKCVTWRDDGTIETSHWGVVPSGANPVSAGLEPARRR